MSLDDERAGRIIVLDVVGLQPAHVTKTDAPNITALLNGITSLRPPFPAVTVPVQATLGAGRDPREHGDIASGEYDRGRDTVEFWGRDRGDRNRLWETAREAGVTTGALFFQHLEGTTADIAVTPSPIEDDDNNLIEMNCWTNPDGFYEDLRAEYGHFPLHNYWGPMANEESSRWILNAAIEAIEQYDPDMLWVYIPHLDYVGLRHGPGEEFRAAVLTVDELLGEFLDTVRGDDRWDETVVNVVSEYGFHSVERPVFPNRALREADLLSVTDDGTGGETVDLAASRAFAMVDHQVTHVYTDAVSETRKVLDTLGGAARIVGPGERDEYGLDHPNVGDFMLVAEPNAWFQYYWWDTPGDAPAYATDMDIHAKPGFDPCELFVGENGLVSLDASKVGGSHGRVEPETNGVYGLGGPAAPDFSVDSVVDARTVAPTIADLLGISDAMEFDTLSLIAGCQSG